MRMNEKEELRFRLDQIRSIFDIQKILTRKASLKENIARYYKVNRLAYRWFHSPEGFVHMGLSEGDSFRKSDFLGQASIVARYIQPQTKKVLELATGKGANSLYLARQFPDVTFSGIDLPDGQIDEAKSSAKEMNNFFPRDGDYHDLSFFESETFDVVFIVEALCHSTEKERVFQEVRRVLRPDGYFIIIDGSATKTESELSSNELLAKQLTEKGMMVDQFEEFEKVKQKLFQSGFSLVSEQETTERIMPTLHSIERRKMTRFFFGYPALARFIVRLLPLEFSANAISGYLMALLFGELKVLRYDILVVRSGCLEQLQD